MLNSQLQIRRQNSPNSMSPLVRAPSPSKSKQELNSVQVVMFRRLSENFYSGGDTATTKVKAKASAIIDVDADADASTSPATPAKPPRTGWRRYLGIIFTFSASLNFSFGVLFAKLLQAYGYHGNCASFWRYVGVTVPAVPMMLYYELGYVCRRGQRERLKSTPPLPLISTSSSTVSIVSKDTGKDPKGRTSRSQSLGTSACKPPPTSTFSTVWPLTDTEARWTAFYVLVS